LDIEYSLDQGSKVSIPVHEYTGTPSSSTRCRQARSTLAPSCWLRSTPVETRGTDQDSSPNAELGPGGRDQGCRSDGYRGMLAW